jgi:hypothetical protein
MGRTTGGLAAALVPSFTDGDLESPAPFALDTTRSASDMSHTSPTEDEDTKRGGLTSAEAWIFAVSPGRSAPGQGRGRRTYGSSMRAATDSRTLVGERS